ncbi:M15 family metallopeptidase [Myceligenerans xiligouense]|uniref:D-alanyl-D-alanine carboxypeptidase-like protein n=1 Tax=Myceligenerans xiligouense TaxID=253184 RepID=A0A3N4YLW1_9MICO|nr:M15 family metallopeptidase [Myceligenerans xiligouense]RPF21643.1 D-alanyl-D-alanine carboxypeptidase-like protein [Myceligenerans xiligouense]
MTQTAFPPPAAEPPLFPEAASAKKPGKRRRGRHNTVIVSVLALLLAVTVGAAYWFLEREAAGLARQAESADTLLTQSEGRVADPATRQALAEQLTAADDVLDGTAFVDRLPGQAAEATEDLIAASDGVWASMVERARGDITTGRDQLEGAMARAEKVYAATESLDGDELTRSALRSALDSAEVTHTRTRDDRLAGAALVQLEQAAGDLGARRAELSSTTDSMISAQDAATCPAPDQLWTPESGRIPDQRLAPVPWDTRYRVRADILDSLIALNDAFRAQFGTDLTVNSAYRSLADQTGLYDPSSPIAAAPGCSTHGLGLAVDLGGGIQTFGTPEHEWMRANAPAHGWLHPGWAAPDGRVPEAWHWQHEKSPAETL